MSYVIEKRVLTPQPVIVVRRRIKRSQVAQTIGSVLPAVFEYAQRHGKALAAHPLTRYVEPGFGMMTIEPGFAIVGSSGSAPAPAAPPVDHPGNEGGAVEDVLPGGLAAITMHHGPYDKLADAYEALQSWIESHGFESAGSPWENYVTDPGEHPDPKDWQTEVCWPIKQA